MGEFEWDPGKAEANFVKHKIDFLEAIRVFEANHFTYRSHRGTEERYVTIGPVHGRLLAVIWTFRGFEIRRLISARRARDVEARLYSQSVSQGG